MPVNDTYVKLLLSIYGILLRVLTEMWLASAAIWSL